MGPILSTIIGAGIKLLCNLVNNWMEQKRQDQMLLAARDNKIIEINNTRLVSNYSFYYTLLDFFSKKDLNH